MSIVEVAKLAGCSHATVSRVINQKNGVSAKAASRVHAAMRQLNYIPPVKRRGPQSKTVRTGNVAVLMIGTDATPMVSPVTASAIHSLEEALGGLGYSLTLSQIRDAERLPSVVVRGDVDGLILHGNPPSSQLADQLKRFPVVWMMSPRSKSGYWGDRIAPDNGAIGRIAAEYLMNRGHRHIAFLNLDTAHLGFPERIAAFQQAAVDSQVACDVIQGEQHPCQSSGDFRAQRAFINHLTDRFIELPDRPTGIFVPRGQSILMVFEALRSRGVEPGKDVTIVACDNDPALAGLTPQIATVDVRPDRIGELAVEQLMRRIEKPDLYARSNILVEPTLVDADALHD